MQHVIYLLFVAASLLHVFRVLELPAEAQREASLEAQRRAAVFGNKKFCDAFWRVLVFAGIFQEDKTK